MSDIYKCGDIGYGGFYPGKNYPDAVGRILNLVRNNGRLEAHLVPLSEEHSLCAKACGCGVQSTRWDNQNVFYHKSDIARVAVPSHLPIDL